MGRMGAGRVYEGFPVLYAREYVCVAHVKSKEHTLFHPLKSQLPQSFIQCHGGAVAEVEAARIRQHRQAEAAIRVRVSDRFGQAGRFFAENQAVAVLIRDGVVRL